MNLVPQLLLVATVTGVGILHTLVPDHWLPISLLARQRRWSQLETARAAALAGTGHVVSTLVIGVVVWTAGVALATRYGEWLDRVSSLLLIAFGLWMAVTSWRESGAHGHDHGHIHPHGHHDGHHTHDDYVNLQGRGGTQGSDHPGSGSGTSSRVTLLLILGSSPMLEGIPAFFAAGRYGPGLITLMALCFALSTIVTYVLACMYSTDGLRHLKLGRIERHGETLSGLLIVLVGLAFMFWTTW